MNDSIIRRLAVACCQGTNQLSLVNELLAGPVDVWYDHFANYQYTRYGITGLQSGSYRNLKKRLTAAGFIFTREKPDPKDKHAYNYSGTVTMIFPEALFS